VAPIAQQLTPDRVMQMAYGFWVTQILSSAAEFDFFSHIASGRRTADDVAAAARTDGRGTRMVLDSLVALQLLTKQNGGYALTAESDAFLVRGRPRSLADLIAQSPTLQWGDWGKLRDALKAGRPVRPLDEVAAGSEFFPKLIRMIMPLSLGPADAVAERLGVGQTLRGAAILDVGAGACAWTIPFATRDPGSRITAFDLPAVLPETAKIVEEFGVASSFRMQSGNYRTDDLGTDYDIVILGNICHIEPPEANRELTARSYRALKSGGRLIIGDMLPNEERTGPLFPIMIALQMFVHGGGDTYTFVQFRTWLEGAGFTAVEAFDTHRSHSPVIIATK
jgi:2-polyprenyl-3-methyl-5-hydroxy-6-metoxy-1,4-benzoquinol methylase